MVLQISKRFSKCCLTTLESSLIHYRCTIRLTWDHFSSLDNLKVSPPVWWEPFRWRTSRPTTLRVTGNDKYARNSLLHRRKMDLNSCVNTSSSGCLYPRPSNFMKHLCSPVHPRAQHGLLLLERQASHVLSEPTLHILETKVTFPGYCLSCFLHTEGTLRSLFSIH